MTLAELGKQMVQLAADLPLLANGAAKDVADAIAIDLVSHTPVDVGEAMSNWRVSLNKPEDEILPAYNPSPSGKMRGGVWTHTVEPVVTYFANVGEATAQIEEALAPKQPGEPIYITNNEPYIQKLNDGSSTQEPAGFVDRALVLARVIVDKYRFLR